MTAPRPVVVQKTDSLCTDEINFQFIVDVSDLVQTTEAELLVMDAVKIDEDPALDLEQRIAGLDRLVGKAQLLLTRAGYACVWGDDRYTIARAG